MTLPTQGLCRHRCTKQSALSARQLVLNFPFPPLAWPALLSQVRADPGESLHRVFCPCDLLGILLCSSCHHVSASTYRATPRAPHVWNREVSQQGDPISTHVQYWCPQAVQNCPNQLFGSILSTVPPCFSTVVGLQSCIAFLTWFHYVDLYLRNLKEESPKFRKVLPSHRSEIHTLIQQASATSLLPCEVRSSQYRAEETTKQESKR